MMLLCLPLGHPLGRAGRLPVGRLAGLHAARLWEGEEQKKIEDWQSCDWTSIWGNRREEGEGRAGFQKMTSWASPLGRGLLASGGRGFLRKSVEEGGVFLDY